jgi:hypothetical protein
VVDDIVLVAKGRFQAVIDDGRLFERDWGFRLCDVKRPVRWWHGDADPFVPVDAAGAAVSQIPEAKLVVRHGESHLGGLATADEILGFLRGYL